MIEDLDRIPRMQPGDVLTAEGHWNPMRDAVGRSFAPGDGMAGPLGTAIAPGIDTPELPFMFRNDSGEAIPPYGVFVGEEVTVVAGRPCIVAELAGEEVPTHVWINGPRAVSAGGFGWCTRANCVPTKAACATGTPPGLGDVVAPGNGTFLLETTEGGPLKLLEAPTNGVARVIRQEAGSSTLKMGKVDSNWISGTATVSVWSNGEDTGDDVTASMPPWVTDWDVAEGAWVELKQYAGDPTWYASEPDAGSIKYGKLDAAWTSGTATVSVCADGEDTGDDVTASMPPWITDWDVAEGTWVELKQYAGDPTWYATPMVSQDVYTDWQFNASSADIEKKTRTAVGPFVDQETDWTKVDDTAECP